MCCFVCKSVFVYINHLFFSYFNPSVLDTRMQRLYTTLLPPAYNSSQDINYRVVRTPELTMVPGADRSAKVDLSHTLASFSFHSLISSSQIYCTRGDKILPERLDTVIHLRLPFIGSQHQHIMVEEKSISRRQRTNECGVWRFSGV